MRYLLFIFLFLSLGAGAQVYQNQSAPMQFTRGTKNDTILVIPRGCDTTALPATKFGARTMGAVYFDTCNNVLYARGSYGWVSVATSIDTTQFPDVIDSTGNQSFRVLFAVNGRISGDGTFTFDTTRKTLIVEDIEGNTASFGLYYAFSMAEDDGYNYRTSDSRIMIYNPNTLLFETAKNPVFSFIRQVSRTPGIDSIYFTNDAGATIAIKDSTGGGSDTTGLGSLYIRNTTTQEDKRFNVRAGRLDSLLASSSAGLNLYSNNGTHVANYGGGGGSNATYYGGVNIDGTTRLATGLTGILKASSGTVATAVSGTDIKTINSTSLLGSGDIFLPSIDSLAFRRYGNTLARNIRSFNAGGQTSSAAVVNQSSSTADSSNILLGYLSGRDLTTGYNNYFLGDNAGLTATTAFKNIAIGYLSYGSTGTKTGSQNIAIGEDALRAGTSISNSIAIGFRALRAATTNAANGSISIGYRSSENITTGSNNVVVANYGSTSQMGATSRDNTHVGYQSASGISSATILQNTSYYGSESGTGATGNGNTGIGRQSLLNATGTNNVGLGFGAGNNGGSSTLSGSGNVLLGAGAKPMSYTASNQFSLWVGANTIGASGYNALSRDSSGRWQFNITTSEVTSISSGAAFEINGTAGGFLMPRGTSAQRTAISAPATGLQYYDTDSSSIMYYNGTRWQPLDKRDNVEATISGNVAMTSANTYYSGPSIVLPVGTWDVQAHASFLCNASGNTEIQLWDGTNLLSGVTVPFTSGRVAGGALSDIITVTSGTLTITLRAYANTAGNTMYQNTPLTSTPNATYIKAVRIR